MNKALLASVGGIVLAFILGFIGLIRFGEEIEVRGELAQIEQLRDDVRKSRVGSNEDVVGQATKWNQEIRSNQRYREIWWARLCVPEEWEKVNVIEIP